MTSMEDLRNVLLEKAARTGSLDAGLLKALWVAYQRGREDALREVTEPPKTEKWRNQE